MARPRARSGLRVFISYRRADSAGHARALHDTLVDRFGTGQVFMDVDGIRPGSPYPETLDAALGRCHVLLALMGPSWLAQYDRRGRRRLDDPEDFVRRELETALRRNILVIPVLLGESQMPAAEWLPGPLRPIATRQAVPLSDRRWRSDVSTLVEELDQILRPRRTGPDQHGLGVDGRRIDAQLEYNLAALQSRGAAVDHVMGATRRELAASDRAAKSRQRAMDEARRNLASAAPQDRTALLHTYGVDSAALADQLTDRGDALSRLVDDVLNGPGALAAAPQPLPDLPTPRSYRGRRRPPER